MKKLKKKHKRQLEFWLMILITVTSFFFWNSIFIYPIKLFVVLCHEICHGLTALFTGGYVVSLEINSYLGGQCTTGGGVPFIIASAGYLGSLGIGSLLFFSGYNSKLGIYFLTSLSVIFLLFTANYMEGTLTSVAAFLFAVLLFISPRYLPDYVNSFTMKTLGLISSIYVLIDIKEDLITLEYRESDAEILAALSGIPAIVWGFFWLLITGGVIFLLIRYSVKEGFNLK